MFRYKTFDNLLIKMHGIWRTSAVLCRDLSSFSFSLKFLAILTPLTGNTGCKKGSSKRGATKFASKNIYNETCNTAFVKPPCISER